MMKIYFPSLHTTPPQKKKQPRKRKNPNEQTNKNATLFIFVEIIPNS